MRVSTKNRWCPSLRSVGSRRGSDPWDRGPGVPTSDVQGAEEAGAALVAALQLPDEGQRGAEQPVRILAAPQQHSPGVGVQVLHCRDRHAPWARPRTGEPPLTPPRCPGRRGYLWRRWSSRPGRSPRAPGRWLPWRRGPRRGPRCTAGTAGPPRPPRTARTCGERRAQRGVRPLRRPSPRRPLLPHLFLKRTMAAAEPDGRCA